MSIIRQTSVRHSEGITMTCENTSSNEVRMRKDTLANPKITRIICTWNNQVCHWKKGMKGMKNYRLDILGISDRSSQDQARSTLKLKRPLFTTKELMTIVIQSSSLS